MFRARFTDLISDFQGASGKRKGYRSPTGTGESSKREREERTGGEKKTGKKCLKHCLKSDVLAVQNKISFIVHGHQMTHKNFKQYSISGQMIPSPKFMTAITFYMM